MASNDLGSWGLPDCQRPIEAHGDRGTILSDGSYLHGGDDSPLIFDVPAGIRITIQLTGLAHDNRYWLILRHVDSQSRTNLILPHYAEAGRAIDPDAPEISAAFDRIIESAWRGGPDTPARGRGGRSARLIALAVVIVIGLMAPAVARWRGRV